MKKRISILALVTFCIITAVVTFLCTSASERNRFKTKYNEYIDSFAPYNKLFEIDEYVRNNFVGEIDDDVLVETLCNAYFAGLGDRFSMYHTKEQMDEITLSGDGKLVGIGIVVAFDIDRDCFYVQRVMKDTPAEKGGIKIGDYISAVDGTEVNADNQNDCINLVGNGEEGSKVTLTLLRDSGEVDLEITREVVRTQDVFVDYLEDDLEDGIALITIRSFEGNVAADFIAAMLEAEQKGIKGYIFDVRGNPGGDLQVICNVLDYILPEGPIIRVKNADDEIVYQPVSDSRELNAPVAVITNGSTASAAELFAAAIRDYEKGILVGTKTYGKGTMQHIIQLEDGSGLRLSCYYYDPPKGENYNGKGILPDINIELDEYQSTHMHLLNEHTDPQIKTAKEELLKIIKGDK